MWYYLILILWLLLWHLIYALWAISKLKETCSALQSHSWVLQHRSPARTLLEPLLTAFLVPFLSTDTYLLHFICRLCTCVEIMSATCGGQRTTFRDRLLPSTVWVPEIKLRLSALVTSQLLTHWASLWALFHLYKPVFFCGSGKSQQPLRPAAQEFPAQPVARPFL